MCVLFFQSTLLEIKLLEITIEIKFMITISNYNIFCDKFHKFLWNRSNSPLGIFNAF